ncbi:hypothetical protein V9K67_15065 [Paraflavisolibacter sp. H34]|uniref:hypothetical protein n=1 Tax=Huijunlia imazamoxiresistens TaxID=3127457 RepID=UPI003016DA44
MKRETPDSSRRGPQTEDRSSRTNPSQGSGRAPAPEGRITEIKNANAAGLGAIGREEGKLGDAAGRTTELENEDIY